MTAPKTAAPATTGAPLLAVSDLHVTLGDAPILTGVDLELRGGEVLGLAGPNGAGKTTLLRAVTGVVSALRGRIALDGTALDGFSHIELARRIAVVQQLPEAPATITVGELVLLGRNPYLSLLGRESAHDHRVAAEAMQRAGCEAFADRTLGTLSGGERRRAFIARALAQEPSLLLLDEPTANLDPEAQGAIFETLRALAAEGAGVLVVVHDLTLAGAYCDRIALIDGGRIVACGAPAEVLTAEIVRRIYGRRVSVMHHPRSGAPIVVPAVLEDGP